MKSLWIALGMYSRLPAPRVAWEKRSMALALAWLPLIGGVIGALLWLWLMLAQRLDLHDLLRGAGAALLPLAVSGGIHLDGLCDTCDALGSHQDRARKLEILKDPHIGAFGVMGCMACLLLLCGGWAQAAPGPRQTAALALGPVLSRGLAGLFAAGLPNARGSGLLAAFTETMDRRRVRLVLGGWTVCAGAAMVLLDPLTGLAALIGAGLCALYYPVMALRAFGGITGDLEGWFIQMCELCMVLAGVLAQAAGRLWR